MKRLCTIIALLLSVAAHGQMTNLTDFDHDLMHYGIQVGYTQSKFDVGFSDDESLHQLLQGVNSYYSAGFHIAVIADLALCPYVSLRSAPGLTLINRSLHYYWEEGYLASYPALDKKRSVESVYGEIPLDLKFRAMRWRNFQPYLTGGCSYGFDFASLRNNKNNNDESIVRLNTSDFRYTTGIGFDFFLHYVKFAIELKMSFGTSNLVIPDDDLYSRSTNKLNSRTFMLGFTFEG
ncbi:MAG: PorT family protein [Bacteroidales bacterium]|nr:PorT family protein [Bacteroidales bacterium]